MLSRTHGQPAVPTTFGKEMAMFAYRLHRHTTSLKNVKETITYHLFMY
jgi:adenylosuccinate lyase